MSYLTIFFDQMSYLVKCRIDHKSYSTNCRIGEMVFGELSCTRPPSRSAHVFNAILNIKILLNGKIIIIKLRGQWTEVFVNPVGRELMYGITLRHGDSARGHVCLRDLMHVAKKWTVDFIHFMRSLEEYAVLS